jgi:hypothetical protein
MLGATIFLVVVAFLSESLWSAGAGKFATREEEIADAIKKNGEIFVGWPKPKFTLIFTGEMDGYIEPCGCAGLENQLGGMKRRYTFLKQLADNGWNPVPLDMGGQVRRAGPQSQIKFKFGMQAIIDCGYQVVGLGFKDLQFCSDTMLFVMANVDPDKNPLVSANIDFYGIAKPFKVIEIADKKIGVTTVLGAKHQQAFAESDEIKIVDPVEGLKTVVPQIEAANCDVKILLVHGDPEEAAALAKQFPQFNFVGTTGGAETPPNRSRPIEGTDSYLVEAGHKGQYAIAIGVYDDPQQPVRYQRVPLDHRFADAKEMQDILIAYQNELESLGLDGLGLKGTKHPVDSFAGSEACADCHTQAYAIWEETTHSHATETLENLDPPRHFDPECLSCHVTGWNPQEYFPYDSGYMGLEESPLMHHNGCENCHGPAAAHVAAEDGDDMVKDAEIEALRKALRIKLVENEGNKEGQVLGAVVKKCQECHDLDNSPDFNFQEYWPTVKHEGMD